MSRLNGYLPSPQPCPWCGQGVVSVPHGDNVRGAIVGTEEVVCWNCHGLCIDAAGTVRKPTPTEMLSCNWREYERIVADLVKRYGPAKAPPPHNSRGVLTQPAGLTLELPRANGLDLSTSIRRALEPPKRDPK